MALRPSLNKSKRQQRDDAAARLRAVFGVVPGELRAKRKDAGEVLEQAWQLALAITEFAVKYLSHFMVDQQTGAIIAPAEFHKELYTILLTEQYAAIAAPREHAKSTCVSVIFVLYCVCFKLRRFIVLIGDTQPQAALQLTAVKEELESNAALSADFGNLVGDKKWDVNDCRTTTGITLAARGAGQSLRGLRFRLYRPDLVILDDVENEEDVDNADSRAKLERWFMGTVLNLGKGCQVFVIGTILHYDGLLAKLLDPEKHKKFIKRRYEAVDQEWRPETVLWPAKWDIKSLHEKEEVIGSVMFNQEFRNLPISESTQIFREEWVTRHAYRREELVGKPTVKISYNDPAISQRSTADFFASVTIDVDDKGFIYVTRAEQDRMPFTKQVEFILRRADEEMPMVIGIEDQAYQAALKQAIEDASRESGRYLNVVGVPHLTDKFLRISTMSPLVENGTIRFCLDGTQKTLISQLLFLGKIKDDLADALEGAVELARRYNFQAAIASSNALVGGREQGFGHGDVLTGVSRGGDDFVRRDRRSRWA
jgi:predicted phage terminase large subunit-like protein